MQIRALVIIGTLLVVVAPVGWAADDENDWSSNVRVAVRAGRLEQAEKYVCQWLTSTPNDVDARAWHARILGWRGRTTEAEAEFRALVAEYPTDTDLLIGLAAVLNSQQKHQEALAILAGTCPEVSALPECGLARARTLQTIGRADEARDIYRLLSQVDETREQSKRALSEMREEGRIRFRVGGVAEVMSFSADAASFSSTIGYRFSSGLDGEVGLTQRRRFGQVANDVEGLLTRRFRSGTAITMGAGSAGEQDIAPRVHAMLSFDHGVRFSNAEHLNAIEILFDQRWNRFSGVDLVASTQGALLYLPHGWEWLIQATISGLKPHFGPADWRISGQTRLSMRLGRRWRAYVRGGTGTENFGTVDQLLFRSSKTVGAGASVRTTGGQQLGIGMYLQLISGGRWLAGYETNYAVRF